MGPPTEAEGLEPDPGAGSALGPFCGCVGKGHGAKLSGRRLKLRWPEARVRERKCSWYQS